MSSEDALVAFVSARLDEDEAAARAATPGPWVVGWGEEGEWRYGGHVASMGEEKRILLIMNTGYVRSRHVETATHIARHDPARVLREVEAVRAVVAAYEKSVRVVGEGLSVSNRRLVLAFAAVYGAHPDFRPEWALTSRHR